MALDILVMHLHSASLWMIRSCMSTHCLSTLFSQRGHMNWASNVLHRYGVSRLYLQSDSTKPCICQVVSPDVSSVEGQHYSAHCKGESEP